MSGIERATWQLQVVLSALYAAGGQRAMHGYAVAKRTQPPLPRPTVYRNLRRLVEAGFAVSWWETIPAGDDRPARRFYQLTDDGLAEAQFVAERAGRVLPVTAVFPPWRVSGPAQHARQSLFSPAGISV